MEEKKLKADEFEAALNEILNQNIKKKKKHHLTLIIF